MSGNGNGFEANRRVVDEESPKVSAELDMDQLETLGVVEVGDNVSDRRFLLETFGMFFPKWSEQRYRSWSEFAH